MVLPTSSIEGLGIGVGGFVLGYVAKTVFSYEYKALRESRRRRFREIEDWKGEIQQILTELRQLTRKFSDQERPDVEEWIGDLRKFSDRIEQQTDQAPPAVDTNLEEDLSKLAGICAGQATVLDAIYYKNHGESEGTDSLPMPFEYDEVANGDTIRTDRLLRETSVNSKTKLQKQIAEVETHLESLPVNQRKKSPLNSFLGKLRGQ